MNRLVVDTNVLINILDKNYVPPKSFSEYDQLCVPTVVLGEYRAGLSNTRRGQVMLAKLLEYLRKITVEVLPVTERTAEMYAKIFQTLRAQGHPIPQNDMWIAASALENGADLATTDGHFHFIPMLTVIVSDADT